MLRRRGSDLEVISNGTFLISTANERSSRALIAAALPYLPARPLEVLIGGLGMGFALDEALRTENVRRVTVAELEPVIVDWFERYGGERAQAARAAAGERSRIVVTDVFDLMRERPGAFDLIALDTDNGPEWLVREPNARLYDEAGIRLAHDALRADGVAVFWSPGEYGWFAALLERVFARVEPAAADELVDGRRLRYTMYVCLTHA